MEKNDQILWLVDALDEARQHLPKTADEVRKLVGSLVLTSRPFVAERARLEQHSFDILPLSAEDIDKFLVDWFSALAEQRGADHAWVKERLDWLKSQLHERPHIRALTRNPLLLTFLVILAGEDPLQNLPRHRAVLYRRYMEDLLHSWESHRNLQPGAMECLYQLGWHMHSAYYGGPDSISPTRNELASVIAPFLQELCELSPIDAKSRAEDILNFWAEAGMLDSWQLAGEEYLAFHHLTFQEYTVAHYLAEAWKKSPQGTCAFLRPRLHHYAWREPVLLLSGLLGNAPHLARCALHAHSQYERELSRDLYLAVDLVAEDAENDAEFTSKVIRKLVWMSSSLRFWLNGLMLSVFYFGGMALFWAAFPSWISGLVNVAWTAAWIVMEIGYFPSLRAFFRKPPSYLFGFVIERVPYVEALGHMGKLATEPLLKLL